MNKRAWVSVSNKSLYSIIVGGACIFLAIIPLLSELGIDLSFLPSFISHHMVIKAALFFGGLFLLYDSLSVGTGMTRLVSMIAGIALALVGALPLLIDFRLLSFLPFIPTINVSPIILESVLLFFGIYLIVDSFMMKEYH